MKFVGDVVAMPKILELTFELNINKVSCPGVWLCQDGMVSLSVFAMGFRYETSLTLPVFPLLFKEVFYFRRRFEESCTMSNIFCLLQDETIYCELVQWPSMCGKDKCTILAQYLGVLNDVLFPSTYCSMDGVDLLMRRSKKFPGILAPKIEISTKVRIDEIVEHDKSNSSLPMSRPAKPERSPNPCACVNKFDMEPSRQKSVCHTPMYHRYRCVKRLRHGPQQSRSFLDLLEVNDCRDKLGQNKFRSRTSILSSKHQDRCREYHQYHVYNVSMPRNKFWREGKRYGSVDDVDYVISDIEIIASDEDLYKPQLRSKYVADPHYKNLSNECFKRERKVISHPAPCSCTCNICRKYHELFDGHPLNRTQCERLASKSDDRESLYSGSLHNYSCRRTIR